MVRPVAAVVLVVATTASLIGFWVHGTIVHEDGWNATLGDLLDDDAVADEVAQIITDRTIDTVLASAIDVPFVSGTIEDVATGPLTDAVRPAVGAIVRSEVGATVWAAAVAAVHDDVVAILRDESTTLVDGSTIRLDLSPLADRIATRIDDALGPLGSLGVGSALDVDLEIVLYDLSEHDTSLDLGSLAERLRVVTLLLAGVAAIALVTTGPDRATALALSGGLVVLAGLLFRTGLDAVEPDGLDAAWSHVRTTADGSITATIGTGALVALVGAGWWVMRRAARTSEQI